MNSERLYKQTLGLHRFKPESVMAVTESVKMAGALINTEESICKRQLLKKEKVSFRQRVPLVIQITLKFQLHAQH